MFMRCKWLFIFKLYVYNFFYFYFGVSMFIFVCVFLYKLIKDNENIFFKLDSLFFVIFNIEGYNF